MLKFCIVTLALLQENTSGVTISLKSVACPIKRYIVTQNHNGILETVQKEEVKN
jgi:hypothetical protein